MWSPGINKDPLQNWPGGGAGHLLLPKKMEGACYYRPDHSADWPEIDLCSAEAFDGDGRCSCQGKGYDAEYNI